MASCYQVATRPDDRCNVNDLHPPENENASVSVSEPVVNEYVPRKHVVESVNGRVRSRAI